MRTLVVPFVVLVAIALLVAAGPWRDPATKPEAGIESPSPRTERLLERRRVQHRRAAAELRRKALHELAPAPAAGMGRAPAKRLGGPWLAQGPAPIAGGQVANTRPAAWVSGAVHALSPDLDDAGVLYVGAVGGGIWRTANAGEPEPQWQALTDGQSAMAIGALARDPSDPRILLAGIGRFSAFGLFGARLPGLLYTRNGGESFFEIRDRLFQGESISGVAARGDVLLAASTFTFGDGGLYRSTDAGATWAEVGGRAGSGLPDVPVLDLAGDPGDPTRFYAALRGDGIYTSADTGTTWTRVSQSNADLQATIEARDQSQTDDGATDDGTATSLNNNTELSVGPSGRVYVAVLLDGQPAFIGFSDDHGSAWQAMDLPGTPRERPIQFASNSTPIVISSPGHALPAGSRVEIAEVRGNTAANGIWTISRPEDDDKARNAFILDGSAGNGRYAGGGVWRAPAGLNPGIAPGGQGVVHFSILADTDRPELVYAGGDRQVAPFPNRLGATDFTGRLFRGDTHRAATGEVPSPQWAHLTHSRDVEALPGGGTRNNSAPHADSRDLAFDAGGRIVEVDDGGVFRRNVPRGSTGDWVSLNAELTVTEMHDIAYDPISDVILAGAQDVGAVLQSASGSRLWRTLLPADGGDVAVARGAGGTAIRYFSQQSLIGLTRQAVAADNRVVSSRRPALTVVNPATDEDGDDIEEQFLTPLVVNAVDPNRLAIGGKRAVYVSSDGGDTVRRLTPLLVDPKDPEAGGVNIDALVYGGRRGAQANPRVLYVGTGERLLFTESETGPLQDRGDYPGAFIRDLAVDPDDWRRVFVIDDDNRVFASDNAGRDWRETTGALRRLGVTTLRAMAYVTGNTDALVVGAGDGVYGALGPSFSNWARVGMGMPNVPVYDLHYEASDNVLVAASMGRGAWKMPDVDLTRRTGFTVDAGISGTWWNPARNGEGLLIDIVAERRAAVNWFTFDTSGNPVWIQGTGAIDGNRIVVDDAVRPTGARFGAAFDPGDVRFNEWGRLVLRFDDCDRGKLFYAGPEAGFGAGAFDIERLTAIQGLSCGEAGSTKALDGGIAGSWLEPGREGEGFLIRVLAGRPDTASVIWFTYDGEGNQAWIQALGAIDGNRIEIGAEDAITASGARFGPGLDPRDVSRVPWGSMTFEIRGCDEATMSYAAREPFGAGARQLVRLTGLVGRECEVSP